jgi:hypothetical protein
VLVRVIPESESAASRVGDLVVDQDGIHVRFAGIPDFTYTIERSADAVTWTAIGTVLTPASGLVQFLDTTPLGGPVFYRTSAP